MTATTNPPTLEEYKKRIDNQYEDMFMSGVTPWTEGDNGDSIPLEEWLSSVKSGLFVDYDGYGFFAFKKLPLIANKYLHTHIQVRPSDITRWKVTPPSWATHVIWFNR